MSSELDVLGLCVVIRKAGFDPVLSIFALRRYLKSDCDSYVVVDRPLLGYDFATGEVSNLPP